jgi:hypothetical protein
VWERNAFLDCPLCRQPIRCQDPVFSYSLSEEHEYEGMFDVDVTESALLTCRSCCDLHNLPDLLKKHRRLLVQQLSCRAHLKDKPSPLVSRYACNLCGRRIPNGERLFTAAFEMGHQGRHRLSIAELKIDLIACLGCVVQSCLRDYLQKMVAALLVDCRRQSLRVIR